MDDSQKKKKGTSRWHRPAPWDETFWDILEIAQAVAQYLSKRKERPALSKRRLDFARQLLGFGTKHRRLDRWLYFPVDARVKERLRAAGVDPETWAIVDKKRAAWCWYQLRTKRYFSLRWQEQLVDSGEEPPDMAIKLVIDPVSEALGAAERSAAIAKAPDATQEHFGAEIRERLGISKQG